MTRIRRCREDEKAAILAIINAAAEAYRGVIPAEGWHEPYMADDALEREIDAGVDFWGYDEEGRLIGVMGIQPVGDVDLIRHAYVHPDHQGRGIGGKLLERFRERSDRPVLIGTWAAAEWAIQFYRRHGFDLVPSNLANRLLRTYWTIPESQMATSVVLADRAVDELAAAD